MLNFLGYSYKFVLDWKTLKFKCLNDKNVIIKSSSDGLNLYSTPPTIPNVFKISTPDGNLFLFTLKDITKINYNSNGQSEGGAVPTNINIVNEVSSRVYKLTSIITNKDEMIKFNYEYSEGIENGGVYKKISKNLPNIIINHKSYVAEVSSNHVPATNGYVTSYTGTESTISYLKSIEYNDEILEFITSSRVDFKEAKKLDKIIVKYKGISKKNIDFKFDYFVADDSGNNWDSFLNRGDDVVNKTQDELTKRLKLLSVNAFNEAPFIFEYNSTQLPKKTSYAKDYWGFYNGIKSNNSFFPNIYSFNLERDNYRYYDFQQNNNSPQVDFCQASILNKIVYPTGGSDHFEYELNNFDNYAIPPIDQGSAKGFFLTTVASPTPKLDEICFIEGGSTFFKIKGLLSTKGCFPQYPEAYSRCFLKVLNFKKELIDYINTNFSSNLRNYGMKYVLAVDLDFLDGNPSNINLFNNFLIPENTRYYRKTANNNNDEFIDTMLSLKEGIAVFSVSGGCGIYSPTNSTNPNWSQSSFNISYRDYKPFSQSSSIGAGLRIKSITSKGFNEKVELKKEYSYEGGKIMSPLLFFNKTMTRVVFDEVVGVSSANACTSNITNMIQSVTNSRRIENSVFNDATKNRLASEISALYGELNKCKVSPIIISKNFYGTKNELSTSSFNSVSTSASGSFVGYQKVVEKFINIKERSYYDNLGRIETNYINNPDLGSSWNKNGGGEYTDLNMPLVPVFPENGLVLKEKLFNQSNDSIKVTINNYKVAYENCLWGMKMIPTENSSQILSLGYFEFIKYLVGVYPLRIGKSLLSQSKTINFFRENGITSEVSEIKNFSYDIYNQLSGVSYYDSNGNLHQKFYKYCYDFNKIGDNFYVGMQNKNFITPVIETTTKLGSAITSLEMNTFKEITPVNSLVNIFVPEKIKFAKSGNIVDLEDRVIYNKYDSNSNPIEVSKKDDSPINFIWGYKGQYPIAKIENSSISQIESALELSYDTLDETKLEAINALRTSLTNAMITTYTHNPLVGVSTITDPKGLKTTYEYDAFNRLKWVKDHDGNILQKYCYNYKGETVNCQ